ncbi:hypothetical protein RHGRI_036178 [Rhododendron griersonianum]|uniref:Calcineurin-like phosphoesterase domain-containing protein n=1 Tax=Rhododendron griersonianum TaxID=479676 RepID=A0AAV6HQ10_9ERIC|nr:hypothetical protein RHGRI_036178 [Rhododendron griersonianum]KAG5515050.1 hypothetical protein RHGRI_036178 [Rhododendron griersonianum]
MASLSLNSFPLQPPSQPRKLADSSCPSSLTPFNGGAAGGLKPIVVCGNPPTFVSAPGRRIVAVGDLHGDLAKARCALEIAGVLSSDGRDMWTGGETAKAKGGAVFQVNGNHETMNVSADFRYVDLRGFDECLDFLGYLNDCKNNWEEAFVTWVGVSERLKDFKMSQQYWDPWNLVKPAKPTNTKKDMLPFQQKDLGQRQQGVIARSTLLRPGGPLACELARHAVVLKVDDWVFCHGGLLPHHVAYGLERMNWEVSKWMRGLRESDDSPQIPFIATSGYDSVVWNRLYSRDVSDLDRHQINQASLIQSILEETLQAVGAKAMVVGHTPQSTGVNCAYGCSIWRIDVGMSSGVLDSQPEVLEIRDSKARAIKSKRDTFRELQIVDYT